AYQMVGAALLHAYLVDKRSIVEEAKGTLPWPDSRREMLTFMFYIERILEIALDNVRQVRELPLWEGVPKLSTAEMQEIINGTDGLTTTPEDLTSWGQLIQK